MAKAGAMVIEWGLLDAQHFGIPQRRRRVFVIAIFNSATANLCPSPLLPVGESLRGNTTKGKPKRKSITSETSTGSSSNDDTIWIDRAAWNQGINAKFPGEISDAPSVPPLVVGVPHAVLAEVEPYLSFDTQFGSNANVFEDQSPTLKASQSPPSVAYPIDTRNALRDPEKYDAQNRQGLGIGNDGDPMATLTSTHVNAVAYDEYNDSINETHHALRAGTKQSTGVLEPTMAVRRLTPLECERLMGWPDDHTRYKADGTEQADTHRYKQCGNGVASPVAEWIGKQLMKLDEAPQ